MPMKPNETNQQTNRSARATQRRVETIAFVVAARRRGREHRRCRSDERQRWRHSSACCVGA